MLGLLYNRKKTDSIPAEVTALVEERAAAKKAKDWGRADAIRAQLTEMAGVSPTRRRARSSRSCKIISKKQMQGRPAHLRRRARVRGLAPDFVCNMTKQRTKSNKSLWVLLGGALLLRLVLALVTDGYPYDMSCFVAGATSWPPRVPPHFTARATLRLPPGYLWVLGLVGAIRAALHIAYESKWTYFLLALVPSLCDCGLRGSSTERQSAATGA